MKKTPFFFSLSLLFIFSISISFSSCQSDALFDDIFAENSDNDIPKQDTPVAEDGDNNSPNPEGKLDINTTPCDYTLNSIVAGAVMEIECKLDLDGATIDLPSDVTFIYKGGEIINGTLNFDDGGKIDGNLLNQFLTVEGAITLTSDIFQFHPERWDFVEGQTTSVRAQANNTNLENLFEKIKNLETNTFLIDEFDAYFEISNVTSTTTNQNFYPSSEAINIPSDFNLEMTDNTHLRTQPNNGDAGVLLAFRDVTNSSVSGGVLHGEREEHDYSQAREGEGGNHLLEIHGGRDITVDGVKIVDGSKGGLNINSLQFTFQPDYIGSARITIKNCVFERNRRMSVALTDGNDILFDGNTFIDTAQPTANSDGGVVGYAINLEGVRKRENGELIFYEKVTNVTLRNNTEKGSRVGAFNVFTGENIVIENNRFENKVAWSFASGTRLRNNIFTASNASSGKPAISVGGTGETVFDNEISGNEISGYSIGISAYHGSLKIYDNEIDNNGNGIQLKNVKDVELYNNTITSSLSASRGISLQLTNADNVNITANDIDVVANNLYFVALNEKAGEENFKVNIKDNNFSSTADMVFSRTKGTILYENNVSNGRVQIINASGVDLLSNKINSSDHHGVAISGTSSSIKVQNNEITFPANTRFNCIDIASTTNSSEVSLNGNECN